MKQVWQGFRACALKLAFARPTNFKPKNRKKCTMKTHTIELVPQAPGSRKPAVVTTNGISVSPTERRPHIVLGVGDSARRVNTYYAALPFVSGNRFRENVGVKFNPEPVIYRHYGPDPVDRQLFMLNLDFADAKSVSLVMVSGKSVGVAKSGNHHLVIIYRETVFRLKLVVPDLEANQSDFALIFDGGVPTVRLWSVYVKAGGYAGEPQKAVVKVVVPVVPSKPKKVKPVKAVVVAQAKTQPKLQPKPQAQPSQPPPPPKNWVTYKSGDRKLGLADLALKDLGLVMDCAIAGSQEGLVASAKVEEQPVLA